jgi:cytoskeleton protein RodZ
MPPIGETLREARLRQRVDIDEVEQATKIRAKYLRALESEEFDRLPGSTFVRTFLRTYAEYLGLDSQLLLEEFRQRHESPREEDLRPLGPAPPSRPVAREGRRRMGGGGGPSRGATIAGAVGVILALLILIGLLAGEPEEGGEEGNPTASSEQTDERPARDRQRERRQQPADEAVTLQVSPVGETYVCVEDADGEEIFEQIIASPETFEGEALRVNFGNTQVDLELNGEEVPIEQSANPVGFEFSPEGEEELPEAERPCT